MNFRLPNLFRNVAAKLFTPKDIAKEAKAIQLSNSVKEERITQGYSGYIRRKTLQRSHFGTFSPCPKFAGLK